jgi:hypothetical protein
MPLPSDGSTWPGPPPSKSPATQQETAHRAAEQLCRRSADRLSSGSSHVLPVTEVVSVRGAHSILRQLQLLTQGSASRTPIPPSQLHARPYRRVARTGGAAPRATVFRWFLIDGSVHDCGGIHDGRRWASSNQAATGHPTPTLPLAASQADDLHDATVEDGRRSRKNPHGHPADGPPAKPRGQQPASGIDAQPTRF